MMVVRPIKAQDWDDLRALAAKTGPGFTSLQDNDEQVRAKLEAGVEAMAEGTAPDSCNYLFVLEDLSLGKVVGVCGIDAAVGLSYPWYNYRVGTMVQASRELDIYKQTQILTISNDFTGYTELCTLFLDPDYRHSKNGHLLSKSRFLFLAEFQERFHHTVLAEMRGYSDANGVSPFWEGLGRHFFEIDFDQADQLSYKTKVFIAELMPKYPIYTNLLPESAREVIGKTHDNTTPARRLLEQEGFRYTGYIDIFDAGPALEAPLREIRAVHDSRYVKAKVVDQKLDGELFLLSNCEFNDYRCAMAPMRMQGNDIALISADTAAGLNIQSGDTLRAVPLFADRRF